MNANYYAQRESIGLAIAEGTQPSGDPIGIVELLCVVVYLIPRTSVLGAILMTGYLGGAVATHVRVFDAFVVPLALGVFAWGGLFLRDARLRELLPLKRVRYGSSAAT